ncbi:MAG: FAD-linked oxidase C-terminal domain-containing protein [Myxococcota bacterium]|jgi:FAD/FMN-containing dehydrogenase/Fe-S oxidoreductase|nr:FAD-linked oxidase C-terminal domain-containing protein [Myxococcota bacterium]
MGVDWSRDVLLELGSRLDGEVCSDLIHRRMYATDASLYSEMPLAVVYPRHREDIVELVRFADRLRIPLIPRAAGTSLSGQTVGNGLVVDVSRHMGGIGDVNLEERFVWVEPGVILDELNRHLRSTGLFFAPDTSTSNRCMIGGMVGNNSCGSHSVLYGDTRAHVLALEVVLSDGSTVCLEEMDVEQMRALEKQDSVLGRAQRCISRLLDEHREAILEAYPKPQVERRNMAYPLDMLAHSEAWEEGGGRYHLGRFFCGSEGTLGIVCAAKLRLTPRSSFNAVVAVHFDSLDASLRATVAARRHHPAAIELIDRRTLQATEGNIEQRRNREWLVGSPEAVLVVELYGDDETEVDRLLSELIDDFRRQKLGTHFPILKGVEAERIWALRKAGLGLLMGVEGDVKAITFVEDTAVAIADLPEYIRQFQKMLLPFDTQCVYYAHASVGELHLRPELNPKLPEDIEKMKAIAFETAKLVKSFRGSLSGEHGDGRVRSPLLEYMFGPEVYGYLREIKAAFDPKGIFNPGKIIDPLPIDQGLRYPPGFKPVLPSTFFFFREDGDILRAIERCNGAGACRKTALAGGVMCPSYHATGDEKHSTRGRANVMRSLFMEDPASAWSSDELYESLDLCLSCKGCKSECPASFDMARLKSEFLSHHQELHGASLRNLVFGHPDLFFPKVAQAARMGQKLSESSVGKWMMSELLGIHPRRRLPEFAPKRLRTLLRRRRAHPSAGQRGKVLLFIDAYADFNEPQIGLAAVEVLERAGFEVLTPKHQPAGRTQISKGFLADAKAHIEQNIESFLAYAEEGIPILGIEPSEVLTFADEALDLVRPSLLPAARKVASMVAFVDVFVGLELEKGELPLYFDDEARQVLLHTHCQAKSLFGSASMTRALRALPNTKVELIASGCCGMAGSFGYEKEHYDVSMAIGEQVLFPAVRAASEQTIICAAGTSCRHQIFDGTGRQALHPIELIHAALRPSE